MKKTKIINLLLLTVSFAASAKTTNEKSDIPANAELISNATGGTSINNNTATLGAIIADNANITRAGFGDDKKHSGAEQSHSNDEKK
jgi:hypothetical protein